MRRAQSNRRDREAGQATLFDTFEAEARENGESKFPEMEEWPENESLEMEKELLGMYISGHPLTAHEKTLKVFTTHTISQLSSLKNKTVVRMGGIIEQVDARISRRSGKRFAFCQLEDLTGVAEITLYSKEFAAVKSF